MPGAEQGWGVGAVRSVAAWTAELTAATWSTTQGGGVAAVVQLAAGIAAKSPLAVTGTKSILMHAR